MIKRVTVFLNHLPDVQHVQFDGQTAEYSQIHNVPVLIRL